MPAEFYDKVFVAKKKEKEIDVQAIEIGKDEVFEIKRLFDTVFVRKGNKDNPIVDCYSVYTTFFDESRLHNYLDSQDKEADEEEDPVLVKPAMEAGNEYVRYSESGQYVSFAFCHAIAKSKYKGGEISFVVEMADENRRGLGFGSLTAEEAKKWNEMHEKRPCSEGG